MDDASFNRTDLKEFSYEMGVPRFAPKHIVGPYDGFSPDAESTLDVQYLSSMRMGRLIIIDTGEQQHKTLPCGFGL